MSAASLEHVRLPVQGMVCGACVGHITRAVRRVGGVESVRVSLRDESATVGFDPARTSPAAVATAIREAGYEPQLDELTSVAAPAGLLARLGFGR